MFVSALIEEFKRELKIINTDYLAYTLHAFERKFMLETLIESQIYCQFTMVGLIYKTPGLIARSGHANPCLNLLVVSLLNRKVLFRLREQFINVGCKLKDGG